MPQAIGLYPGKNESNAYCCTCTAACRGGSDFGALPRPVVALFGSCRRRKQPCCRLDQRPKGTLLAGADCGSVPTGRGKAAACMAHHQGGGVMPAGDLEEGPGG